MKAKSRDFDLIAENGSKDLFRSGLESKSDKTGLEVSIDSLDYCGRKDLARKLRIRVVSNGGGL